MKKTLIRALMALGCAVALMPTLQAQGYPIPTNLFA